MREIGGRGTDKKGCSRCGKSCCQLCNVMSKRAARIITNSNFDAPSRPLIARLGKAGMEDH